VIRRLHLHDLDVELRRELRQQPDLLDHRLGLHEAVQIHQPRSAFGTVQP